MEKNQSLKKNPSRIYIITWRKYIIDQIKKNYTKLLIAEIVLKNAMWRYN